MMEENLKYKAVYRKKSRKYFVLAVLDLIGIAALAYRGADHAFKCGANSLAEGITDSLIESEKNTEEPRD